MADPASALQSPHMASSYRDLLTLPKDIYISHVNKDTYEKFVESKNEKSLTFAQQIRAAVDGKVKSVACKFRCLNGKFDDPTSPIQAGFCVWFKRDETIEKVDFIFEVLFEVTSAKDNVDKTVSFTKTMFTGVNITSQSASFQSGKQQAFIFCSLFTELHVILFSPDHPLYQKYQPLSDLIENSQIRFTTDIKEYGFEPFKFNNFNRDLFLFADTKKTPQRTDLFTVYKTIIVAGQQMDVSLFEYGRIRQVELVAPRVFGPRSLMELEHKENIPLENSVAFNDFSEATPSDFVRYMSSRADPLQRQFLDLVSRVVIDDFFTFLGNLVASNDEPYTKFYLSELMQEAQKERSFLEGPQKNDKSGIPLKLSEQRIAYRNYLAAKTEFDRLNQSDSSATSSSTSGSNLLARQRAGENLLKQDERYQKVSETHRLKYLNLLDAWAHMEYIQTTFIDSLKKLKALDTSKEIDNIHVQIKLEKFIENNKIHLQKMRDQMKVIKAYQFNPAAETSK